MSSPSIIDLDAIVGTGADIAAATATTTTTTGTTTTTAAMPTSAPSGAQAAAPSGPTPLHAPNVVTELPRCTVVLDKLSHRVQITTSTSVLPWRQEKADLDVLRDVSAEFRSGTMTLVMAAHGGGKSALLKAIAARLPAKQVSGEARINGQTDGFLFPKVVGFVGQKDVLMPLLTPRETLMFALECTDAVLARAPKAKREEKVNAILGLLGLEECADTLVGDEMIRGISGGQKKRVSIGEMLMGNPRVLCLDEITSGLDSATAFSIMQSLRHWADTTGGTIIATLLQPTPEVFQLFDNTLLLKDGRVVFRGPRTDTIPYIEALGVRCPPSADYADFVVDFLTHPLVVYQRQLGSDIHDRATPEQLASPQFLVSAQREIQEACNQVAGSLTTDSLVKSFSKHQSELAKRFESDPSASTKGIGASTLAQHQYTRRRPHGFIREARLCLNRQAKLFGRDVQTLIIPRIMQNIMLGIIIGTFYRTLQQNEASRGNVTAGVALLGFVLGVPSNAAFFSMVELPIASAAKVVLDHQVDAEFFSARGYITGLAITYLPFAFVDTFLFGTLAYFIAGLSYEAEAIVIFYSVFFVFNLAMSSTFRFFAFASPSQSVAQVLAPCFVATNMIFGGFLVGRNQIPDFLIWIYYISPFSWMHRALSINELNTDRFDDATVNGQHSGDFILEEFGIFTDRNWIWAGAFYLLCWNLLFMGLSAYAIGRIRYQRATGTRREGHGDEAVSQAAAAKHVGIEMAATSSSKLPFIPAKIVWQDMDYTVYVGKAKTPKQLLTKVSGGCLPGRMVALMGASGAGKTTLLDVIAARKSQGLIEGKILVNGTELAPAEYSKLIGYVEQSDTHVALQTVREALEFSAFLRLPTTVTAEQRATLVDEVLDLLNMSSIQHRMIGNPTLGGISDGQRKLVSIGIELSANPSILFLDEPTTGLDSLSAYKVVEAIQSVARSGRSVICTVHQPSTELVLLFDDLLLLQTGGHQVYLGELGYRSQTLIRYFEGLDGVDPMPERMNPATWMLDVLNNGAPVKEDGSVGSRRPSKGVFVDFPAEFKRSDLLSTTMARYDKASDELAAPKPDLNVPSFPQQFAVLFGRYHRSYYRDFNYNGARLILFPILGLLFGLIYFDLETDSVAGIQSLVSLFSVSSAFLGVVHLQAGATVFASLRPSFYREQAAHMYRSTAHSVSLALVELPYLFVTTLLFFVIMYPLVGLTSQFSVILHTFLLYLMLSVALAFLGQFLVGALPNDQAVQIANGFFQGLWFSFNGVFNPESAIPNNWLWFYRISPYNHVANALSSIQVETRNDIVDVSTEGGLVQVPAQELVEQIYNFKYAFRWRETGIIAIFLVVFFSASILAYKKIRHNRR